MFLQILSVLALSVSAHASRVQCELTEIIQNQNNALHFSTELNENSSGQIVLNGIKILKNAKLVIADKQFKLTYEDINTGRVTEMTAGAHLGEDVRFEQIFERPNSESFTLDCLNGERQSDEILTRSIQCRLIEKADKNLYERDFSAQVAQNGHDVSPLPPARLNSVNGWVLPFNGLLGIHMRDQVNYKGRWVAIFGSLKSSAQISWYPNKMSGVQATVVCDPVN